MNKNIRFFLFLLAGVMLAACSEEDDYETPVPEQPVELNCKKPDYLKTGDKVALISPSYYTPMTKPAPPEGYENTAPIGRTVRRSQCGDLNNPPRWRNAQNVK